MKIVKTTGRGKPGAYALLEALEQRGAVNTARLEPVVRKILNAVRQRGDKALLKYAQEFDGLQPQQPLRVTPEEMEAAWKSTSPALQAALKTAAKNIRAFAEKQRPKEWSAAVTPGVKTGQLIRPLQAVGCYVPGGRYPLPSTVFMTVLPAKVAGVERIVVVSPKPAKETLAAAWLAGVTEFYRIGGAQAVAALAYGTESVPAVDKIVGPGNLYVTTAKKLVAFDCGIDMLAGPTEIVVTSETGKAKSIAADLVAQAEHDPDALAILITSNSQLAQDVAVEVKAQSKENSIAKQSLAASGVIFVTKDVTEARKLTNRLAPEHLTVDTEADLKWVKNAGSVFVGPHTPQTMGDYISGPNHVLPTGRVGRVRGGLSVMDFVKVITVQSYTREGLAKLGPPAIELAEAEGLKGHAQSVRVRLPRQARTK
ncbi:MAG: histidinol dehydrogenase [Acidobacteriaceae bacterium]